MKTLIKFFLPILVIALISACELDNYEEPSSELTGHVVYNGEPINVASGQVELELWQSGFELNGKIKVNVRQDGSFTALLFDGDYKLTQLVGSGPWVNNSDSIDVQLRGAGDIDFEVEPFYTITNESINFSNGSFEATFNVNEINDSRDLEFVGLYIGTTSIVDQIINESVEELDGDNLGSLNESISLSMDMPGDLSNRDNIFARIGVKTEGVSQMVYSQVVEITLE